jgi:hypothetical protein
MTRKYSSISVETTLASGISNSATSMTVAAGTGSALMGGVTLNTGDQFTVALDPDTNNEEIVFITVVSGDTMTITRARASSSAVTHSAGATVKHVLTSDDLNWFESNSSPVPSWGLAGSSSGVTTLQANAIASGTITFPAATDTVALVGATQTFTNKTLTSPTINTPTINDARQNVTLNAQTGTTYTLVLTDNGRLVTLDNANAITVTVPLNSSVAFATGAIVNLQQIGAGQVTVAGASGVTVNATGTKTRAQWSAASLVKTGTDTWTLIGDITV